jgi:hypothetical protein
VSRYRADITFCIVWKEAPEHEASAEKVIGPRGSMQTHVKHREFRRFPWNGRLYIVVRQQPTKWASLAPARLMHIVCLGNADDSREDLAQIAALPVSVANDMRELTLSGANRMQIGGQVYRFVRSFTQVGVTAAVVFSTDLVAAEVTCPDLLRWRVAPT